MGGARVCKVRLGEVARVCKVRLGGGTRVGEAGKGGGRVKIDTMFLVAEVREGDRQAWGSDEAWTKVRGR